MNDNKINISAIKAFNDNYIWAITSPQNNNLALVDPGDASVCIAYIEKNQLSLTSILVTHHHQDHIGGIKRLLDYAKNKDWPIKVFGPTHDDIAFVDIKLDEGDQVHLEELAITFNVFSLPGHTKGHIGYVNSHSLFCGDTLFSGGCGRLFEGSPEQMHHSLTKLANLPESTLVYCAHEYTQANLDFAITVEPDNKALIAYKKKVTQLRVQNKSTLPSSIALEKQINPFLRCHQASIIKAISDVATKTPATADSVFAVLRQWKDTF